MKEKDSGNRTSKRLFLSGRKNAKSGSMLEKSIEKVAASGLDTVRDRRLSSTINENYRTLSEIFSNCYDVAFQRFEGKKEGQGCLLVYICGMVDQNSLNESIFKPIAECYVRDGGSNQACLEGMQSRTNLQTLNQMEEVVLRILSGSALLFFEGLKQGFALDIKSIQTRSVSEAKIDSTTSGPQEAFVEDASINVNLIRKRLKTPMMKLEMMEIGKQSHTKVVLAYIKDIADAKVLKEARKRIRRINMDMILDTGQLRQFIEDDPLSPLPQVELTERPDSVVAGLAEGRFAILLDGSPFALIAPTTISYLFTAADDYYQRFYYVSFMSVLRYFSFFLAILGPSLYIAVTTFHPELVPLELLVTIAGNRAEVPFPALMEAILMEITFEIIVQAGTRLPSTLAQPLSIVGALVIGQISVEAGLVSPLMIIVVSITGISSFLIPKLNSSRQISVIRFPMMMLGATLGFFGIIMGVLALLIHALSLRSFGVPYFSPYAPFDLQSMKDSILKMPEWLMTERPKFIQRNNTTRVRASKPKPPTE